MANHPFFEQNHGKLAPKAPNYLGNIASATWRRIVPYLESTGKLQRIDYGIVEMYCTQYEIYRNAYAHIKKHGQVSAIFHTVCSPSGEVLEEHEFVGYKPNPSVNQANQAVKLLDQLAMQLGLSPKGRKELFDVANSKKQSGSPDWQKEMKKLLG